MKWIVSTALYLFSAMLVTGQITVEGKATIYNNNRYFTWLSDSNRQNMELLAGYIKQAPYLGLEEQDYEPAFIQAVKHSRLPPALTDTATANMHITTIAIRFFRDVAYGSLAASPVKFNGPPYQPGCYGDIAAKLADCLAADRFAAFLQEIEPLTPEYAAVKNKIALFYKTVTDSAYKDVPVITYKVDTTNTPLLARLNQLGILDSIPVNITVQELQVKLRMAQRMFNLLDDGSLRSSVVKALNIPLSVRLKELKQALNQLRWLYCCRQQAAVVIVNIPSNNLFLYQQGKLTLTSRVITGKRAAPTPTLCSRITEVVLYPYWMVPRKIATRELLPHIQQNISYLEDNQFQVLDSKGSVVDPARINWRSLNTQNFPYTLRQGTGCDNSLGIIKLNFHNPYSVYLHDTPWKGLFILNQRFFSHGCIRVEEAATLARLLLEDKAATMDTLIAKGCQPDQKPVSLPLQHPVWVFVLYNTSWLDEYGEVRFYGDMYHSN